MQAIKKMGPLNNIVSMMPGVPKELKDAEIDDREIARIEAIIRSMTPGERVDPSIIDGSRRTRIADGSGTTPSDVNNLVKQFKEMQRMLNNAGGMGTKKLKAKNRKGKGEKGKKGKRGGRAPGWRARSSPKEMTESRLVLPGLETSAAGASSSRRTPRV
ncbi:MAG: hypothetical protein U5R31_12655 [Acidimicrobiia bacterium]|nr:hypothetical protein [Acidimicrobiia bacterium]